MSRFRFLFCSNFTALVPVAIDYLNEPENTLPRAGAIALGAASGFVIGLRHGFIRRLLYTTIGGGALASICYPKEAEVYAQKGLAEAKTLTTIGVNFVYGGEFRSKAGSMF